MKKIDFIDIIRRAAILTWNNRFLWFFGFFILIGSIYPNYAANLNKTAPLNHSSLRLVAVFILVIFLVLYALKLLATAALIKSANNAAVYKSAERISILKEAREYFWTLLSVELLLVISLLAIFLVIATPVTILFLYGATAMASMMGILGAIILVPIAVSVFFLKEYAYLFAVIGGNKTRASLERAYDLFKNNIRESLAMGFFLVLAALSYWLALLCFLIVIFVILCLVVALLFLFSKFMASLVALIFLMILLVFFIIAASLLQAFLQVSWVLFFQKIAFMKDREKIVEEKLTVLENATETGTI